MESTLRTRHDVLAALREEPLTKPELVDRVSVSRSTVDRAVKDLLLCDLLEAEDSRYRATETGRLALEAYRSYQEVLDTIETASPVLDAIPPGTVSLQFLRGATVDRPDPRAPMRVLEESAELVYDARTFRGTGPVAFDQFFDHLSASATEAGLTCELVLDRDLFESFDSPERETLREIVAAEGGSLYVTPLKDPFAIWIADHGSTEHAGLTVYEGGGIAGVIRNDDPEAVAWAAEQYRRRKADAEAIWEFD